MMSLTFGLFTQVSGSGPLGPLVLLVAFTFLMLQTYRSPLLCVWILLFERCIYTVIKSKLFAILCG